MSNAARKARKARGEKFERQPKTPTHRYMTKTERQARLRILDAAYEKLRRDTNATPPPAPKASTTTVTMTTPSGDEVDLTKAFSAVGDTRSN